MTLDAAANEYLKKYPDEDYSKVISKIGNSADGPMRIKAFEYAFKE